MCRLFGFRSVLESHVHRSLTSADNALAVQSSRHPDGWGVAYYVSGAPHVIRSSGTAISDQLFQRVSGVVTSQTVLAHIRKATQGVVGPLNCHPFQYGRWVLAHNGDVPGFPELRGELLGHVAPRLRPFLLGDTDSELVFHVFLSELARAVDLGRRGTAVEVAVDALKRAVDLVRQTAERAGTGTPLLTLLVSDGELMIAHQGGKELWWSTWKNRCAEREGCPYFSAECEAPSRTGYVNHLLVSSEPLQGENHWIPLAEGEVVAVDHFMRLQRSA
jgi:glutamine amidotransferase